MKIARIEAIPLRIPFAYEGAPAGWGGHDWKTLDTVLVKVETEDGLIGWGDAFAYNCLAPVAAAVERMATPIALGMDSRDIAGISLKLQRDLHLFGRYGITMFAISGLEIALWDIAGKRAGQPLHVLLGGRAAGALTAYASLYRYGDPERAAARAAKALAEGFRHIKLHEIAEAEIKAVRATIGGEIPLMVDTNCPWTPEQARLMARRFKPYDLHWLEEPIFPPEDFAALAKLGRESAIPIAAGENACTAFQFQAMIEAGAVSYAQPSVTKVGGIGEFLKVAALAEARGVALAPHSPYFGPGFLATLHLAAARPAAGPVEWFHLDRAACLYGEAIRPREGRIAVPEGPGLGLDPDPAVIKDYRAD